MKRTVLPHLTIIIGLVTWILPLTGFSQEKMKFGKIDPEDLKMQVCPFDSSADAMILGDIGKSSFNYIDAQGFVLNYERHIRIKIFTKKGFEEANLEIPYYHNDQDREKITNLKARTYNLEEGKVVETKVEDASIFDEDVDAYWKVSKVAFPAVREGSIIELRYTITSPFLSNLRDWYFQGDLPVGWSEYETSIPEFFHYSKQVTGPLSFTVNEQTTLPRKITETTLNRGGDGYTVSHSVSTSSLDYIDNNTRLAVKNAPAFREEPYTSSILNYVAKIEFEYTGYQFPHEQIHTVNATWKEIVENLEQDKDFGQQLKKGGLVDDVVKEISAKATLPYDRMLLAHEYIKLSMKWNEVNSKYPTENLRKALQVKSGNCADINLSLVLLLRELGLTAYPVILSTRENGLVLPSQPAISKMNYVIAMASVDGKEYLLDATSRVRPVGLLPFQCLNNEGLVVSKDSMRWIPLLKDERNTSVYYSEMKIFPEGEIRGKLDISLTGYEAVSKRRDFMQEGEENYRKSLKANLKEFTIENLSWKNMENLKEPLTDNYQLSSTELIQATGNMIYFNVLLNLGQRSNPFRQEKREYPVDFGCPLRDTYTFAYEIPEGYAVESLPEPLNLTLPDEAGSFRFITSVTGNRIMVSSKLSISKVFYFPADYETLKALFDRITAKHAQQIILKKI